MGKRDLYNYRQQRYGEPGTPANDKYIDSVYARGDPRRVIRWDPQMENYRRYFARRLSKGEVRVVKWARMKKNWTGYGSGPAGEQRMLDRVQAKRQRQRYKKYPRTGNPWGDKQEIAHENQVFRMGRIRWNIRRRRQEGNLNIRHQYYWQDPALHARRDWQHLRLPNWDERAARVLQRIWRTNRGNTYPRVPDNVEGPLALEY